MPTRKEDLPGTITRSPKKVRETYAKTLDAAHEQYPDDEERAHRTAWASVKHVAEQSGPEARDNPKATYAGVDVNGNTKAELYERAKDLDIEGRSGMSKHELAEAIGRRQ